ncbi:PREDICTED: uncharacterized protein LOC109582762 [Amphimedon queenslandica]|uniref:Uncharacterized protein n=1 Tax=Amphimedon queenslandica TaxID=400682 RepID=A0A1X7UPA8_AMPQE|nr:PREDICTED: uncharacterized protein LOC109582762 [Amphimedon queenslandica]|eukprot:XP_019853236.1 PREDICTED: uncharacterized protein LOC109582762 [Amphimedon queenslandica]
MESSKVFTITFFFYAAISAAASLNTFCQKANIESCSPSYNESSCCLCRGDTHFMLDTGLKTGHRILDNEVTGSLCNTGSFLQKRKCKLELIPVMSKIASFSVSLKRLFQKKGEAENELFLTAAAKIVARSVEEKICNWISTLFPDKSCSQLLAQLHLLSLMEDSREASYTENPSCSHNKAWRAVWAESAYCREVVQQLKRQSELDSESFKPCSS